MINLMYALTGFFRPLKSEYEAWKFSVLFLLTTNEDLCVYRRIGLSSEVLGFHSPKHLEPHDPVCKVNRKLELFYFGSDFGNSVNLAGLEVLINDLVWSRFSCTYFWRKLPECRDRIGGFYFTPSVL